MTLKELQGKYARVRAEIDTLDNTGRRSEARLARLGHELQQLEQSLLAYRRLTMAAPTLNEVVPWAPSVPRQDDTQERRGSSR